MEAQPPASPGQVIEHRRRAESLGAEITELCARRYALEARFLELLREFDDGEYWAPLGFHSCAHWLNFHCGLGLNAARERLRVAHALADLPTMARAFAEGRLSYSKLRAMTRVADASNEAYLMSIATHGTAWHVETLVRKTRRVLKTRAADSASSPRALRSLDYYTDADGLLVLKARLPAEQGALVVKALQQALELAEAEGVTSDVSAETSDAQNVNAPVREPKHARRADGLVRLAETFLADTAQGGSSADRYRVVLHVSAETLAHSRDDAEAIDVTAETSCLEHGPHVTAETSRRLGCDAAIVALLEDARGLPLSVGRQTRSIPPWLRRALEARDGGCRFPGCTHTRFVDAHHIVHWANGGETALANLVLLCSFHHSLVHEGGFICEKTPSGEVIFRSPDRRRLAPYAELPGIDTGEDPLAWLQRHVDTAHIDEQTCVTHGRAGDRIDWDLAVGHMFTPDCGATMRYSPHVRLD